MLPLSLLEEEQLQRVRLARQSKQGKEAEEKEQLQPQAALPSEVRREEESTIAHWRQQFYFPPTPSQPTATSTAPTTHAAIAQLVHHAAYGNVVNTAFSQLLPGRPARWDEVKRRLALEAGMEEKEAMQVEAGTQESDEERERRLWEMREKLDAEAMDKVREMVAQQAAHKSQTASAVLPVIPLCATVLYKSINRYCSANHVQFPYDVLYDGSSSSMHTESL